MKDTVSDDHVVDHLNNALESGALPKAAHDYAKHLLKRLSQPVRVSVLGAHESGKSALINMFLGRSLIPEGTELPTTEIVWGDAECMTITAADGSVTKVHSVDLDALAGLNAAFLQVELPVPILKRINLLEVVTENSADELSSGVDWAVRRTDIALWCTQEFDAMERDVWSKVPDSMKDHAFIVLTKADLLSAQRLLSKRVAELETVVAEEFHSLYAVASLKAVQAHGPDGVDENKFRASGGEALSQEVLRHAERGRRADLDSAHMFLARYQSDLAQAPARRAADEAVAAPETAPAPAAKTEDVATAAPPAAVQDEPARETTPQLQQPQPQQPTVSVPKMVKVENVELFSDAVRYLRRRGDSLSETLAGLEPGDTKGLIDTCVDAVEHLTDLFSQDESGCEAADAFIDELAEATDVMVLMQVEDGDAPAADAVTLLLQLRHDMELQLAA